MVEVPAELTSTNLHHPAQPPPSFLSWIDEYRRSAASADPCRPVNLVEPGQRGRGRGGPATGPRSVSRFPVAVRADGDPRARGDARATGSGRPWLPARRPVRVPGDQRRLSADRRRPAAQPGDLRRSHARRRHPAVGSRPRAAGNAAGASHRLVPHAPAAPAEPHRARPRDARALLRGAVAGDVAAGDRPGGVVGLHPTAVLRTPLRGVDPSGWEEALVRDVEEPPRLQSGDSTSRTDAANAGGEATFRAGVSARVREPGAASPPPSPPPP